VCGKARQQISFRSILRLGAVELGQGGKYLVAAAQSSWSRKKYKIAPTLCVGFVFTLRAFKSHDSVKIWQIDFSLLPLEAISNEPEARPFEDSIATTGCRGMTALQ